MIAEAYADARRMLVGGQQRGLHEQHELNEVVGDDVAVHEVGGELRVGVEHAHQVELQRDVTFDAVVVVVAAGAHKLSEHAVLLSALVQQPANETRPPNVVRHLAVVLQNEPETPCLHVGTQYAAGGAVQWKLYDV